MTATYDPSRGNLISKVRFVLGDTNPLAAHFVDEEITASLNANNNIFKLAAAELAQTWATQLRTQPAQYKAGSIEYSYLINQMNGLDELAARLRAEAAVEAGTATDGQWAVTTSYNRGIMRRPGY